jgi:tRNA_anti-like
VSAPDASRAGRRFHRAAPAWIAACAVLLPVLTAACVSHRPDQDRRILAARPAAKLSADLLWKDYQDNRAAADRQYLDQALEVTGTVTNVGPDAPTDRYVMFGQTKEHGVRAVLLDDQAADILSHLPDSRRLTLRCFCDGLNGDVVLKSCVRP